MAAGSARPVCLAIGALTDASFRVRHLEATVPATATARLARATNALSEHGAQTFASTSATTWARAPGMCATAQPARACQTAPWGRGVLTCASMRARPLAGRLDVIRRQGGASPARLGRGVLIFASTSVTMAAAVRRQRAIVSQGNASINAVPVHGAAIFASTPAPRHAPADCAMSRRDNVSAALPVDGVQTFVSTLATRSVRATAACAIELPERA